MIIALYLVFPAAMGVYATFRHPAKAGDPPDGFNSVTLTAADGVELAAWYAAPRNGAAIVLAHGATDCRENVRNYAEMLYREGFGVLAYDQRGHGESGGRGNALGWENTLDVGAATSFLEAQEDVSAIGAMGLSLGGEVLLGAASAYPGIRAIAADGATHRTIGDYLALTGRGNIFRSWTTRVMYATAGIVSGQEPPGAIVDSIGAAQDTAFLFIAAGNVPDESAYGTRFLEAAGARGELWTVPDVGHIQAFARYPEEYTEHIVGFFHETLISNQ